MWWVPSLVFPNPRKKYLCRRQNSMVVPHSHREKTFQRVSTSEILLFLPEMDSARKTCPLSVLVLLPPLE